MNPRDILPINPASYNCMCCGDCCRHQYIVGIRLDDVLSWEENGREDIVAGIQIDMKSISPAVLIPLAWYAAHRDMLHDASDVALPEHAFIAEHEQEFTWLIGFITQNHEHLQNPLCSQDIPHWFLPATCYKDIFRPHDLDVVEEGLRRGVQYIVIQDIKGACEFLDGNLCGIHETKPADCHEYPNWDQIEHDAAAREKFLALCKGINQPAP